MSRAAHRRAGGRRGAGWRGGGGPLSDGDSPPPSAPVNSVPPSITGTVLIGNSATITPGTWSGSPTLTYTLLRGGTPAEGAEGLTEAEAEAYAFEAADIGRQLVWRETATNGGGSASSDSNAIAYSYLVALSMLRAAYDPAAGLSFSAGDDVSAWADQSGYGQDLSTAAGTPLYLPTGGPNGQPCVQFASGERMTRAVLDGGGAWSSMSYAAVLQSENTGTRAVADYSATSRFGMFIENSTNRCRAFTGGSANVFATGTTSAQTAWNLWITTATDGGQQTVNRGTTQEASVAEGWAAGGPGNNATLYVGSDIASGSTGLGRLALLLVLRSVMSSSEIENLAAYCAWRFAI